MCGSEAVKAAQKMARAYHLARGEDWHVIIGRQGEESWQQIDAREMAAAIGTIPYEVVCRIGSRIERHYTGANR